MLNVVQWKPTAANPPHALVSVLSESTGTWQLAWSCTQCRRKPQHHATPPPLFSQQIATVLVRCHIRVNKDKATHSPLYVRTGPQPRPTPCPQSPQTPMSKNQNAPGPREQQERHNLTKNGPITPPQKPSSTLVQTPATASRTRSRPPPRSQGTAPPGLRPCTLPPLSPWCTS